MRASLISQVDSSERRVVRGEEVDMARKIDPRRVVAVVMELGNKLVGALGRR